MALANITSVLRAKIVSNSYSRWLKKGDNVVDVGCGTGIVAKELGAMFRTRKMVGCDIDNYLITNIKFKKMISNKELPFKNDDFDVAMFNDVLHHTKYENQIVLIKESLRVANTVLIFELIPNLVGKIGDFLLNKIHNPNMKVPFTYRSQKEWEQLFRKNKINFEKKEVHSPFWYPFDHIAYRITK